MDNFGLNFFSFTYLFIKRHDNEKTTDRCKAEYQKSS